VIQLLRDELLGTMTRAGMIHSFLCATSLLWGSCPVKYLLLTGYGLVPSTMSDRVSINAPLRGHACTCFKGVMKRSISYS